jgi:OmpA-OmpF porin, OOP family
MKRTLLGFLAALLLAAAPMLAQDADGCKDHPLLSRMKNFHLESCAENYNQLPFLNLQHEEITLEGNLTHLTYKINQEPGIKEPSTFQVVKNYSNAIQKSGGKKIFEDQSLGCYEVKKNGKTYNIRISNFANMGGDLQMQFDVDVLEMTAMEQEISANEMLEALNKDGFIALNILFETGKAAIQTESLPIVDRIFEMTKAAPDMKVSIEGHTDNVGAAPANKKLSTDRAKAVMDALIAKGVAKIRLSFVGWGQENPVGDNRTEDGRARNRRVEIVKK